MATELGAIEAESQFGDLLRRAAEGEEIIITRHGTPVARLVPYAPRPGSVAGSEAAEALLALGRAVRRKVGPTGWPEIKALRDHGHR